MDSILPPALKKQVNDLPQMDLNLMQVEIEEAQEHEALTFKNLVLDYESPPFELVDPKSHFS